MIADKENWQCFGAKSLSQILRTPNWHVKNFEKSLSAK